ncbi:MAG: hypothetical protein WDN04_10550 [Rhodospirillales bacterium]
MTSGSPFVTAWYVRHLHCNNPAGNLRAASATRIGTHIGVRRIGKERRHRLIKHNPPQQHGHRNANPPHPGHVAPGARMMQPVMP